MERISSPYKVNVGALEKITPEMVDVCARLILDLFQGKLSGKLILEGTCAIGTVSRENNQIIIVFRGAQALQEIIRPLA